ncbi:hypothetical protein JTE90_002629 [Oedothorax gibbosus]|uniref:Uncharacterized protein n=1 Tax=Oedothorax gibbosus TaxID=931172 RepID=A0AAV6VG40_9ARAC|nr:hypothetical protein JTE90_002629 [Oedothorax gibbosus]
MILINLKRRSWTLLKLDDLANQFKLMKQEINTRFENFENKEIIHNIAASYASVTKTNNKSEIVAPSDLKARSINALPNAESHVRKLNENKTVISGTGNTSKLLSATRFPKRSAVFVSRLGQMDVLFQDFMGD